MAARELLDLTGVLDLIEQRTGTRPQRATVRVYQQRAQMPAPSEPGRWVRTDIEDWIRQRRGRTDTEHSQAALAALTEARDRLDHPTCVDQVRAARAAGASWAQIGAALDMTKQGAWNRFHAGIDLPQLKRANSTPT